MTLSPDGGALMSPGLLKVAERAKRDPDARFNSLAHLVDEAALGRAFGRIRKDAAVGVDGITKEQYGQRLGGKPPGAARTAEVDAVPASADPAGAYPEGTGQDAADRYLHIGGQDRAGCAT